MKPKEDLYRVLGIRPNSSRDTITRAYRKKAMKYHPDRNPGDESAVENYRRVQEAYEVLSDPARRKLYDETGSTESRPRGEGEVEAMSVLFPILMDVIQGAANGFKGVAGSNLVERMQTKLSDIKSSIDQNVVRMQVVVKNLNKTLGRFTVSEGENLIEASIRQQIANVESEIEKHKAEWGKFDRTSKYLAKYGYKTDSTPTGSGSPTSSVNAASFVFGYST